MKRILSLLLMWLGCVSMSSMATAQFFPGGLGNAEMPFWFVPEQAYTAAGPPYPAPTNGADVLTWLDGATVIGGANNATQATAANRPNYSNTGIYGGSSVVFTRTNADLLTMVDDASINTSDHTEKMMSVAFNAGNLSHNLQIIFEEGGGTNGLGIYLLGADLYVAAWSQSNGWPDVAGNTLFAANDDYRFFRQTINPNTDYLVTLLLDIFYTNTMRAFLNGAPMNVNDGVNPPLSTLPVIDFLNAHGDDTGIGGVNGGTRLFNVGAGTGSTTTIPAGGSNFQGRIGEITYYNSAKNTERKIVENYFSTKYQFALAASDMFPQNPAFRTQMIGIGQETTSPIVNSDRVSINLQSSGGFFLENVSYFQDAGDYVFAAHNTGVGTTPDGTGGAFSNRLWLVQATDVNGNDGNVRVSFDLSSLSLASPACVSDASQYYLRNNGANTRLGLGTYNAATQTISFVVPASEIDGSQITLGVASTSLPTTEVGACNNGCDDDGDGLVDCYDNDCNGNAPDPPGPDPACDDYFFGQVPPNCVLPNNPDPNVVTAIEFETDNQSFEVEQRGGVFIGDVVPDNWAGYPAALTIDEREHAEIVAKNPYNTPYTGGPKNGQARTPTIYIFPGQAISTPVTPIQSIITPVNDKFSMLTLGDVDSDGNGDIFITASDRRVYRFEFNPALAMGATQPLGSEVAVSTVQVQATEMTPALADFDQNGVPEVYVGNAIYNAVTLANYIAPNAALSAGIHPNDPQQAAFPVAYDVFSPSDIVPATGLPCGGNCQGLELVTGNRVYAVNLSAGTLTLVSSAPAGITDGRASVADMDNDGRVDIVTCGYNGSVGAIYVWNPRTQTQMGATFPLSNGGQNTTVGGRPNLADVDGDRTLEIVVGGRNRVFCIEVDADGNGVVGAAEVTLKWASAIDETSDRTSGSTFDFNGDGQAEVIYSDEENVLIYRGDTGALLTSTTSRSGTRSEYPIVADVDKDGFSELIVTSQDLNGPSDNAIGRVTVYGSNSGDWVSSRPVWNQHTYLVTNVEDNLRIPAVQQSHVLPGYNAGPPAQSGQLNAFIKQVSFFDSDNNSLTPTGNLAIVAINSAPASSGGDVDYSNCLPTGDIVISVTVTNDGDANLPADTPITFYDDNPFTSSANILQVLTLGVVLAPGDTQTLSFTVNVNGGNFTMFVYGNIDGNANPLPQYTDNSVYDEGECNFDDNGQPAPIDECILPISLISFYADNLAEKVVVHWATANELNNDYYIVERAGEDLEFKAIGRVEGKGTNYTRNNYLFNDYEPLLGTSYYRLRQIDFNGDWSLTKAIAVTRMGNDLPPALYPNPNQAGRELFLRGLVDKEMVTTMSIISLTGQIVQSDLDVQSTIDGIKIQLPTTLAKGVYILNVVTEFGVENFKFVIE